MITCEFCKKEYKDSKSFSAHCCILKASFYKEIRILLENNIEVLQKFYEEESIAGAADAAEKILSPVFLNPQWSYRGFSLDQVKKVFGEDFIRKGKSSQIVRELSKEKGFYKPFLPARDEKSKKTMLKKYGVINNGQLEESRKKLSARNNAEVYHVSFLKDFETYSKKASQLAARQKKKIAAPEKDYYTGLPFPSDMRDPFLMQGDLYPTLDHKLSILYCFLKNIPVEECSSVSNLVWTFRILNTKKQHLTESQFRESVLPLLGPLLEEEVTNLLSNSKG